MQEAFVDLNGVPTRIITWGRWIEEGLDQIDELVICVTGNPGLPDFYTEFSSALRDHLSDGLPVWVIGHAGHDQVPATSIRKVPALCGNEKLYNLDGQVKHKIDFIQKYVPSRIKIHLIGHSIGAWMVLQMLENETIRSSVKKCYLLFPTIERMIDSRNGYIYTKFGKPLYSYFGTLLVLFDWTPLFLRSLFIQIYFLIFSIPNAFLSTVLKYVKPEVVEKVVFLADDEMERVKELPIELINSNLSSLKLFYGTTDGWVPVRYYKEFMQRFPKADAILDSNKIEHSFVLRKSKEMGKIVAEMIEPKKD